jgi:phospholipid-transporting ATPase
VVGLSMIKDLYEDIKRHLSDRSENNNLVKVAKTRIIRDNKYKQFLNKKWKEIRVGEIIKVYEN